MFTPVHGNWKLRRPLRIYVARMENPVRLLRALCPASEGGMHQHPALSLETEIPKLRRFETLQVDWEYVTRCKETAAACGTKPEAFCHGCREWRRVGFCGRRRWRAASNKSTVKHELVSNTS